MRLSYSFINCCTNIAPQIERPLCCSSTLAELVCHNGPQKMCPAVALLLVRYPMLERSKKMGQTKRCSHALLVGRLDINNGQEKQIRKICLSRSDVLSRGPDKIVPLHSLCRQKTKYVSKHKQTYRTTTVGPSEQGTGRRTEQPLVLPSKAHVRALNNCCLKSLFLLLHWNASCRQSMSAFHTRFSLRAAHLQCNLKSEHFSSVLISKNSKNVKNGTGLRVLPSMHRVPGQAVEGKDGRHDIDDIVLRVLNVIYKSGASSMYLTPFKS